LRRVAGADLDRWQRRTGVDLDDSQVCGLVDADDARRPAQVLRVGVGGELDVDFVSLVDYVVIGDDVALGVDDEAGPEGFANAASTAIFTVALVRRLAAKEAVEEVLEIALAPALALLVVGLIFVV